MTKRKSFPCLRCELSPGEGVTAMQFRGRSRSQLERHVRRVHAGLATVGNFHRRQLGGGNTLRAVTRARRSAPGRQICHVDGVKPAVWRAHLRRERQALLDSVLAQRDAMREAIEREAA